MSANHRRFHRFRFCLAWLIVGAAGFAGQAAAQNQPGSGSSSLPTPQEIDSIKQNQADNSLSAGLQNDLTKTDSQGQRVFEVLFTELDNMIPGDFSEDLETRQAIEDAVTAFQLKDINRVRSIFKEQAARNKNFPPPDLLLASLSYAVQDAQSGLVLLERAAIASPDYPGVYLALARLAINQGRISDSLALLEKCERINQSADIEDFVREHYDQQLLDGLTDVAMRQERYDDARQYLEQIRATTPKNAKVLMVSAELEFRQNNIEKSQEYLQSLKSEFPATRPPESILATWYQRTGNQPDAEKWIRKAASKYAEDPQVQLEFASWAVNEEDFPTASSAIIKAEKKAGETPFSQNLKGKIAFCNRAYGIAEAHYRAIAQQQPNNFDAVNMYALSLIESNDPKKQQLAREIAARNFRALPENLVAQAALGYVELKLGETEQAKAILTRAARTPGTAPEIDYFLAALLAKMGETQQAKLVVESALKNKGLFLYRSASQQLLDELDSSTDTLPEPGK